MVHPPRSNPPLRSSSGPPIPCITPSRETKVVVVSFMIAVPFLVGLVVVRSDRAAPISSVVARTVPQNLAHLLPPSIRVPSMVLRDGWRGIHRKLDRVGRVLRDPSDTCSASFAGHRRARLPRRHLLRRWVNEGSPKPRMASRVGRRDLLKVQTPCAAIWRARRRPREPEGAPRGPPAPGRAAGHQESPSPAQPRCRRGTWDPRCRV